MMMEPIVNIKQEADSLEVLFDLFNDDICQDILENENGEYHNMGDNDNGDETSSESSGSSGLSSSNSTSTSPPFQQISTYYPSSAPPTVTFSPNPLSSFTSEVTQTSNKRTKTEDKLIRNRMSANKSRLKRKHEKIELEETVATLRERVRTLEMENNALLTDNTTLSQHNYFLQELLKKQQFDSEANREAQAPAKQPSHSHVSAISGISVLCVVFSVSFFSEWLPSSLLGASDTDNSWSVASSSGRVLLSVDDDEFSGGTELISLNTNQKGITFQYLLILTSLLFYYFYVQYENTMQKKLSNILPS